ncbi:S41 family peptidase [Patescibacteria group bacterium]|nr:S41 family peptidase [Patescibacteria group bacterium]
MNQKLSFFFKSNFLSRYQRPLPPTLVVVFVLVAFLLGYGWGLNKQTITNIPNGQVTNVNQPAPDYLAKDIDFSLFWKVWQYVHNNYINNSISDTKLFYGAIAGMVQGLEDPYSIYMDPQTAQEFASELAGSFDGIGAEIGVKDQNLVIVAPLPDTPADRAGLKSGDRILAIENTDTTGMAVDKAVRLIRGERGTAVKLLILSKLADQPKIVEIVRDKIVLKIVQSEIKELPSGAKVGYIRLAHFSQNSDILFKEAWTKLLAQGSQSIIFDLRNNPGGFLDQGVAIASHWITEGVVVSEKMPKGEPRDYKSTGAGELVKVPTVVLVNEGSASASEIVTGALQDYGLATIIGQKTFGKGSVQNLEEFPDGSAVKLTVAKWYTPKGRSIDKNGLEPDIKVDFTEEDLKEEKDVQLERALQFLAR